MKLISTDVFNINVDTNFREGAEIQPSRKPHRIIGETRHRQPLKRPSSNRRATIEQPLTNKEIRKERNNDDIKALGNSLAACEQPSPAKSSVSVFECYQNHIKWPEFAAHAKRLGKPPTAEWFKRWLVKQKPQWRNKKSPRQEVLEEFGYTLDGKFYTSAEANGLATKDPNLIEKFRTATRRNGKVVASKCSRATSR